MRSLAFAATLAACCTLVAPGAAQEPESPEALVTAYIAAMHRGDWDAMTGFMHPDALRDFKAMFTPLLKLGGDSGVEAMFDVPDAAAFVAASPADLFRAFIRNIAGTPELFAVMANSELDVIGSVPEQGTDVTHVVHRMTVSIEGMTVTKMEVTPVRQDQGRWRAMLSGDLEGMATVLKQTMQRAAPRK